MDRIRKWSVWQLNLLRYLTLILVVAKDRWKSWRYNAESLRGFRYAEVLTLKNISQHECSSSRKMVASRRGFRSNRLRSVPAAVQNERRRSWLLLRAQNRGQPNGARYIRSQHRVLYRPDRKEASQSFLPRYKRSVLWYCGVQFGLSVLPKLGYLQIARSGEIELDRRTGAYRAGSKRTRLQKRCIHLQ